MIVAIHHNNDVEGACTRWGEALQQVIASVGQLEAMSGITALVGEKPPSDPTKFNEQLRGLYTRVAANRLDADAAYRQLLENHDAAPDVLQVLERVARR